MDELGYVVVFLLVVIWHAVVVFGTLFWVMPRFWRWLLGVGEEGRTRTDVDRVDEVSE